MAVLGKPVSAGCLAPDTVTWILGFPKHTSLSNIILASSDMVLTIANSLAHTRMQSPVPKDAGA